MSGYPGDLNDDQQARLNQFRESMQQWLQGNESVKQRLIESKDTTLVESDLDLLRFLRARKWNIEKAQEMLINTILWRLNFEGGVHNIKVETCPNVIHKRISFFSGYDKENRPVCYVIVKKHDANTRDLEEYKRFCVLLMETCKVLLQPPTYSYTLVFDLDGFSLKNMDYPFVKFLIEILQNYYPETLGIALVVNAPWLFNACWKLIKPWLDPDTANKVIFIKNGELTNFIDENKLHATLGGSSEDELALIKTIQSGQIPVR